MSEFHFIRPWVLLTLIVYFYWLWLSYRAQQIAQKKTDLAAHLIPYLTTGKKEAFWLSPKKMLPVVLGLLIVIISGPTWQPKESSLSKNLSPVIFVVDLSRSMATADIAPSRIESAKYKLASLLDQKADGLVGAWVYAGSGHQLIPPTEDHDVLSLYLASLNTQLVPRQGKNLSAVLEQLRIRQTDTSLPASIVVVSDSIDNQARQALIEHQQESQDQVLVWKFGFEQSMSTPNGITFLQMTADDADIQSIIDWSSHFNFFDPSDSNIVWQEAGYWLVFPVLLLSLLWFRRGWSVRWTLTLFLVPYLSLQTTPSAYASDLASSKEVVTQQCDHFLMRILLSPDQQGQWFYNRQNYNCAANSFVDPQWKIEALMRSNRWEWALTMLNAQPESLQRSFNIGMSYLHLDRFRSAERWFLEVLKKQPEHPEALHNLAILDNIFELMALRAQGQGTAGEDMTADVIDSLQEDMQIDEPEDKVDEVNSADLMAEERLTKIWLEQVKNDPAVFLRNKFALQLQQLENPNVQKGFLSERKEDE